MRANAAPDTQALRSWQRRALVRYLAAAPRDFLAVATPGSGKTAFALRVAGELARATGILPATAAVSEAVDWAWDRFTLSSDAVALDPAEQAITQLQLWLLERWDVTVKNVDTLTSASTGGDGRPHQNNRETVAWYDAHHRQGPEAARALTYAQIDRYVADARALGLPWAGGVEVARG